MKKILAIFLSASLMMACNSTKDKEGNVTAEPTTETHEDHGEKATGLVLNNGVKWKADSITVVNVSLLQTIVSNAREEKLENYLQTATQLQDGLNKMVKECKMKGADHDALHQWLEPLLEQTKELGKVTSVENGATILNEIDKRINLFPQYFE